MTLGKFRIHREGYKFIAGALVVLAGLNTAGWLMWPGPTLYHYLGFVASLILFVFIVMFFRAPSSAVG